MISIIIPCFNGYRYMWKCLDALERQTFRDFEAVIVDDCSTDDSFQRLQEYKDRSKLNIRLLRNEKNAGPGKSREAGVKNCAGDQIAFCDCDDWYEEGFLERMHRIMEKEQADLVMCDSYSVTHKGKKTARVTAELSGEKTKNEQLAFAPMSLCRLLINKRLLSLAVFPDIYYGEDGAVLLQLIFHAKKMAVTEQSLYNYLIRRGSASSKPSKRAYLDNIRGYYFIEGLIQKKYPVECEFIGIKRILYASTLSAYKASIPTKEIKRFISDFCRKNPDWKRNRYLGSLGLEKRIYLYCLSRGWYGLGRMTALVHGLLIQM